MTPTAMSAGCRPMRWRRPGRADPQGRGAAHAGVSRAVDQAAAARSAVARRAARASRASRTVGGHAVRRLRAGRASCADRRHRSPTSSRSPSVSSARPICGAARPRSASTARGWSRSRSRPAASPARATATCRKRRSARRCLPTFRSAPRRSPVLEGPCRDRARPGTPAARQRVSHGGRDRADRRGGRAHPRRGQRDHQHQANCFVLRIIKLRSSPKHRGIAIAQNARSQPAGGAR